MWAQTPAPEPDGPTRHLPYGDDARTTQFVGVDDLVTQAGEERHEPDAFAHLFRDQQQGGHAPMGSRPFPAGPAPSPGPGRPAYPAARTRPAAHAPGEEGRPGLRPAEVQRRDGGGHHGLPPHRLRPHGW